jgi:hypothetical protein
VKSYHEVDIELDEALEEVRRWCSHLPHGCVHMTLVRHAGLTVDHDVHGERMCPWEIARVMEERPHKGNGQRGNR